MAACCGPPTPSCQAAKLALNGLTAVVCPSRQADVAEVGMEHEFIAVLGELKPGKRQLVLKRLSNWNR